MDDFLKTSFLGNTLLQYLVSAGILVGGVIASWVVNRLLIASLSKWAGKTDMRLDDFVVATLRKVLLPLLLFGALFFSIQPLALHAKLTHALIVGGKIVAVFLVIRFLVQVVRAAVMNVWVKRRGDDQFERQMKGLMPIVSTLIWAAGAIFLMDNLGFKISTVVAGLGIGGIAVALGAQAVLGDLFAYFSIAFDRPFEVGDFIIVGDFLGSVERVGIKTTRLRSLGGEQLVFSNTDLTGSRVRNYKRMEIRRIVFKLGVTYDTPAEKLKEIPGLLKDIMGRVGQTRVDRAHFASYGDFALVFECVYYVLSADYNIYMDVQEKINFAIKDEFQKRGIEFAFPTQTLHVNMAGSAGKLT